MSDSKGIHDHPLFKLGKAKAKRDKRNLMFAAILKAAPKIPTEYDFDLTHKNIPLPMFGNDQYGDCVMAGRAHQTLRFELLEQGKVLDITTQDVENEYFKESGGKDTGLVVLDSLSDWRKQGWTVAGQDYKIQAYSEIAPKNHNLVKQAVFLDVGVGLGLNLPKSAQAQFQAGKPWDVASGSGSAPGSWGGHYVYVSGYTTKGPMCITWARKQQITWAFLDKYCDEVYAIIDAKDTAKKKKALNYAKLKEFLAQH